MIRGGGGGGVAGRVERGGGGRGKGRIRKERGAEGIIGDESWLGEGRFRWD